MPRGLKPFSYIANSLNLPGVVIESKQPSVYVLIIPILHFQKKSTRNYDCPIYRIIFIEQNGSKKIKILIL